MQSVKIREKWNDAEMLNLDLGPGLVKALDLVLKVAVLASCGRPRPRPSCLLQEFALTISSISCRQL